MTELEKATAGANVATLKSVIIKSQVRVQAQMKRIQELEILAYDAALMRFGSLYQAEKYCKEKGIPLR